MEASSPPPRTLGGPGYEIVEQAAGSIRKHGMLSGGECVVVALSGGPDSTCLFDVLWRLAGDLDLSLVVAHVDHGLSESSAETASRVAAAAAKAGFEAHVVRAADLAGPNLHARARAFRYGFFDVVAGRTGADRIATGHTLDDRVETTLARLVHGAGTAGLAGLPPSDGARIRPLSEIRRSQTRAYCAELGLEFTDDPANKDLRFERTAVRERLMSAIEERWGEGGVRAAARSAERLGEDAAALGLIAERAYREIAATGETETELNLDALQVLPRGVQRRVLERAVGRLRDRAGGIDAVLDALAAGPRAGTRFALPAGGEIVIEAGRVVVSPPENFATPGDAPDEGH